VLNVLYFPIKRMLRNKDSMNSKGHRFVMVLAVVILLAGASSASADSIVNYKISGPGSEGTFTASFSLPQNPTPSGGNRLGFDFANLPVDVNGTWKDLSVSFYDGLIGEGLGGSNNFSFFLPLASSFTHGPPLLRRQPWILGLSMLSALELAVEVAFTR